MSPNPQRSRLRFVLKLALVLALALFVAVDAGARAGGGGHSGGSHGSFHSGGGSYHGSSGGGGGDGLALWFIFDLIGRLFGFLFHTIGVVPTLLICGGAIALFVWLHKRQAHAEGNVWSNLPDPEPETGARPGEGVADFRRRHPDFDEDDFRAKVEIAFRGIQEAWSRQDLNPVRRFISDGVYQRFNTQFTMMRLLEQTNPVSGIRIHGIRIDRAETDQGCDVLQVAVRATMSDSFRCALNPSFNQDCSGPFTEYWSFVRRQKPAKAADGGEDFRDIYQNTDCPNCGAPLPADLGERGQCPHCGTLVNSGEYDWVLSEITQAEDYAADRVIVDSARLKAGLAAVAKADPRFCVQLAEDKASNAFMQIVAARVRRDASLMRRFVDDQAFARIEKLIPQQQIVYNRLFLNRVTLSTVRAEAERHTLAFSLALSSQRVLLEGRRVRVVDPAVCREELVLLMSRSARPGESKGSLYMHQCGSCGAPVKDSLDVRCGYCGQAYNSGAQEWVVSGVLSQAEYRAWLKEAPGRVRGAVDPSTFDNLYDVRDYAMGNLMVMMAADGVFAEAEREYAAAVAAKLGFKVDSLQALFELAASGKLALRMPDDTDKRAKIIAMMETAAAADGEVGPEEKRILDHLRGAYARGEDFRF